MRLKMELMSQIILTTNCERLGDKQSRARAKSSTLKRERLGDNKSNTRANRATFELSPKMTQQNKIKA